MAIGPTYDGHRMASGAHSPTAEALGGFEPDEPDLPRCPACGELLGTPLLQGRDRLYGLPGRFAIACCEACGLGVTLPVVDSAQLASLYPAVYGAHDELPQGSLKLVSAVIHCLLAWQALHTKPLDRLACVPAGRMLDVGCGRGDLGSWFVHRGWVVTGVEPSEQACAVARQRGVDARAGVLAEVELEPASYDVAVFRHSLEHVIDPVGDLRRVRQALRDDGMAIVSVPDFGCWQRRLFGDRWLHLDLPRHRIHFDAPSLHATLVRAGFSRVDVGTLSSVVALPASIQYAIVGRCMFPSGWKLRLAIAVCAISAPASWLVNRTAGGGDVLYAVARAS
jgi:SAM-dependent methyltransferase